MSCATCVGPSPNTSAMMVSQCKVYLASPTQTGPVTVTTESQWERMYSYLQEELLPGHHANNMWSHSPQLRRNTCRYHKQLHKQPGFAHYLENSTSSRP